MTFSPSNNLYGFPQANTRVFPAPVVAQRSPTNNDIHYNIGQAWIDVPNQNYYGLVAKEANVATWSILSPQIGGVNILTGDTGGGINPLGGNISLLGTANQIVTVGVDNQINFGLSNTVVAPGTLTSTGLFTGSASATIVTGAVALNLGADAGASTINLGTGSSARAINIGTGVAGSNITMGAQTGSTFLHVNTGSGGVSFQGTGAFTVNNAAGAINIGAGTSAQTVNLGTGVAAKTVNLGSTTTTSTTTINAGSGGIILNGALAHVYVATGAKGLAGTATLTSGTVVVATQAITSSSKIIVSYNTPAVGAGVLSTPAASIINGTSFVINSTTGADSTSTVNWFFVN